MGLDDAAEIGGLVLTDVAQFVIMAFCSLAIAFIAMKDVTTEQIEAVVPEGWDSIFFGWRLDLDWSEILPALEGNVAADGYTMFGLFFMAMLFKGILISIAGPAPNYDMQRILAAKNPREASYMSAVVSAALLPRWWMIAGITVLALHYLTPAFQGMGHADFEMVLPWVIKEKIPPFLLGVLLAGLLAAFMSTFSATLNAGGAYLDLRSVSRVGQGLVVELAVDLAAPTLPPEAVLGHGVAHGLDELAVEDGLELVRHSLEAVEVVGQPLVGIIGCRALDELALAVEPRLLEGRQAAALAGWMPTHFPELDAIYSSTMQRARETAEPLAVAYGMPLYFDDRLREVGNNRLDHIAWPSDDLPEYSDYWGSERPFSSITPDREMGESLMHFRIRVGSFIEEMIDIYRGKKIAERLLDEFRFDAESTSEHLGEIDLDAHERGHGRVAHGTIDANEEGRAARRLQAADLGDRPHHCRYFDRLRECIPCSA